MKRHLTIDDLARDDRFERMRIEDLVFVTGSGCEILTSFTKDLVTVG